MRVQARCQDCARAARRLAIGTHVAARPKARVALLARDVLRDLDLLPVFLQLILERLGLVALQDVRVALHRRLEGVLQLQVALLALGLADALGVEPLKFPCALVILVDLGLLAVRGFQLGAHLLILLRLPLDHVRGIVGHVHGAGQVQAEDGVNLVRGGTDRHVTGCEAALGLGSGVAAGANEGTRDVHVVAVQRGVQRRPAELVDCCVVGAADDELLHDVHVPGPRGDVERRVGTGAGVRVQAHSSLDEGPHDLNFVALRGFVQGVELSLAASVQVHTLRHLRDELLHVTALGGLSQAPRLVGGLGEALWRLIVGLDACRAFLFKG